MITEPIRDKRELMLFLNFYSRKKPNTRNHCLIVFGLNTALRISDILTLKWENIYDFNRKKFRKRITVREQKTGKKLSLIDVYTCYKSNYITENKAVKAVVLR
jgi:integrase